MKTLKRIALIMVSVMMLLGVSAFAKESPVKTSFNASLKQTAVTYDGKTHKPSVTVTDINGKKIAKKYYTVSNVKAKNAGSYTVTIKGKGKYAGFVEKLTYKINKKTQKVTVKNVTVKANKKKSVSKKLSVSKKAGKATYTTNNKNIKVKNGKVVVKKGTKKGTYKVTVTVKAKNYKTVTKQIKVTVK